MAVTAYKKLCPDLQEHYTHGAHTHVNIKLKISNSLKSLWGVGSLYERGEEEKEEAYVLTTDANF